jgi:hypothetical protein
MGSTGKKLPYNGNGVKGKTEPIYACEKCGTAIDQPRVYAALSRGRVPTYCSDPCRNQAKAARARERKKTDE